MGPISPSPRCNTSAPAAYGQAMRCQFYVVTAQTQSGVSAILALNAQKMAETAARRHADVCFLVGLDVPAQRTGYAYTRHGRHRRSDSRSRNTKGRSFPSNDRRVLHRTTWRRRKCSNDTSNMEESGRLPSPKIDPSYPASKEYGHHGQTDPTPAPYLRERERPLCIRYLSVD